MTKKEIEALVTPAWINEQMTKCGIENKIALVKEAAINQTPFYEGVDETNPRPLAKSMRVTLYWFFKYMEAKNLYEEDKAIVDSLDALKLARQNKELLESLTRLTGLVNELFRHGAKIYDEEKEWIEKAKQLVEKQTK